MNTSPSYLVEKWLCFLFSPQRNESYFLNLWKIEMFVQVNSIEMKNRSPFFLFLFLNLVYFCFTVRFLCLTCVLLGVSSLKMFFFLWNMNKSHAIWTHSIQYIPITVNNIFCKYNWMCFFFSSIFCLIQVVFCLRFNLVIFNKVFAFFDVLL